MESVRREEPKTLLFAYRPNLLPDVQYLSQDKHLHQTFADSLDELELFFWISDLLHSQKFHNAFLIGNVCTKSTNTTWEK